MGSADYPECSSLPTLFIITSNSYNIFTSDFSSPQGKTGPSCTLEWTTLRYKELSSGSLLFLRKMIFFFRQIFLFNCLLLLQIRHLRIVYHKLVPPNFNPHLLFYTLMKHSTATTVQQMGSTNGVKIIAYFRNGFLCSLSWP